MKQRLGICILLAVIAFTVFGQTLRFEFVNYDDGLYVNEKVNGVTWGRVVNAFTHGSADNWDPLTTFSHMLDCQFFGLNPGGHHLTNVLLHAATVILLFLVLQQMTRAVWRSAFVAAIFAIHPLRAESVAWVSERKDVLSGLFFMFTLWAYAKYADKSKVQNSKYKLWYACTLVLFTLGLMSKPMLVTIPFVLLLLDHWPLRRFGKGVVAPWRLILEKIPMLALAAGICIATLLAQMPEMNREALSPLSFRIGNAFVSYVTYLVQMICPVDLTAFYPIPRNGWPLWQIVFSVLVVLVITALAFAWKRERPYLLTGWLWYLGMLVPVIGIVQMGWQARADRYTYLPQIGIYLALAWTAFEWGKDSPIRLRVLSAVAVAVIASLSIVSFIQTAYWRDSESLWTHALTCTSSNATAHNNLGAVYLQQGRIGEAMQQYEKALALKPNAPSHNNIGAALLHAGRVEEAIRYFEKSVALQPDYSEAHDNLGIALSQVGKMDDAIEHLRRAVELRPDNNVAHYNLGHVLLMGGRAGEAIEHFQKALESEPNDGPAHANLGRAFAQSGQSREAMRHCEAALRLQPDDAEACKNVAWLLATCPDASLRDGTRAIKLAEKAVRLSGGSDPMFFGPLAAAYAEAGRFTNAVETAQNALRLAIAQNNTPVIDVIRQRITQFEAGIPVRDSQTNTSNR